MEYPNEDNVEDEVDERNAEKEVHGHPEVVGAGIAILGRIGHRVEEEALRFEDGGDVVRVPHGHATSDVFQARNSGLNKRMKRVVVN